MNVFLVVAVIAIVVILFRRKPSEVEAEEKTTRSRTREMVPPGSEVYIIDRIPGEIVIHQDTYIRTAKSSLGCSNGKLKVDKATWGTRGGSCVLDVTSRLQDYLDAFDQQGWFEIEPGRLLSVLGESCSKPRELRFQLSCQRPFPPPMAPRQ